MMKLLSSSAFSMTWAYAVKHMGSMYDKPTRELANILHRNPAADEIILLLTGDEDCDGIEDFTTETLSLDDNHDTADDIAYVVNNVTAQYASLLIWRNGIATVLNFERT